MNVTNIDRLITHLQNLPPQAPAFDMTDWFRFQDEDDEPDSTATVSLVREHHTCGTAACLAGHIAWAFINELDPEATVVSDAAGLWLDLDRQEQIQLFMPRADDEDDFDPYKSTTADAVKVLQKLRDTGDVDWSVTA